MLNLLEHVDEVTSDAWMVNIAMVDLGTFSGKLSVGGTSPGKTPRYPSMTVRVRWAADS